jgi:hypothetical protein
MTLRFQVSGARKGGIVYGVLYVFPDENCPHFRTKEGLLVGESKSPLSIY